MALNPSLSIERFVLSNALTDVKKKYCKRNNTFFFFLLLGIISFFSPERIGGCNQIDKSWLVQTKGENTFQRRGKNERIFFFPIVQSSPDDAYDFLLFFPRCAGKYHLDVFTSYFHASVLLDSQSHNIFYYK